MQYWGKCLSREETCCHLIYKVTHQLSTCLKTCSFTLRWRIISFWEMHYQKFNHFCFYMFLYFPKSAIPCSRICISQQQITSYLFLKKYAEFFLASPTWFLLIIVFNYLFLAFGVVWSQTECRNPTCWPKNFRSFNWYPVKCFFSNFKACSSNLFRFEEFLSSELDSSQQTECIYLEMLCNDHKTWTSILL